MGWRTRTPFWERILEGRHMGEPEQSLAERKNQVPPPKRGAPSRSSCLFLKKPSEALGDRGGKGGENAEEVPGASMRQCAQPREACPKGEKTQRGSEPHLGGKNSPPLLCEGGPNETQPSRAARGARRGPARAPGSRRDGQESQDWPPPLVFDMEKTNRGFGARPAQKHSPPSTPGRKEQSPGTSHQPRTLIWTRTPAGTTPRVTACQNVPKPLGGSIRNGRLPRQEGGEGNTRQFWMPPLCHGGQRL
ncbi:hypothetical protein CRENBAI_023307 [Crenichthys baileyi]|uniref:Uncharacterized protein n=1 Tax=Crenichthys baileyi TaxID=28760 RepID=A0AAV9R9Y2_9TELE